MYAYVHELLNEFLSETSCIHVLIDKFDISTIGDKIVETLSSNGVTLKKKTIHTSSPSPPYKVGVFVVYYR